MNETDIEVIEHAKAIIEYCKNHKIAKIAHLVYGEEHDCSRMTCEECWNEAYITDRTEERSK